MNNDTGRREVVQDPLQKSGRELLPERQLSLTGVRDPARPNLSGIGAHTANIQESLGRLQEIASATMMEAKDDAVLNGKMMYMQGVSEEAMLATGNRFTEKGYRTLEARDKVQSWYSQSLINMQEHSSTDPVQYQEMLKSQRASMLDGITDPDAKKIAIASFEDTMQKLVHTQSVKQNEYNRDRRKASFMQTLLSTGTVSDSASYRPAGSDLAVSDRIVAPVMQPSTRDRDIAIRTMLGEAGAEGAEGMAAVAHVLRNRALDGRWPTSIAGVALQPNAFSAWNLGAGGNDAVDTKEGKLYDKAGEIFDTVMAGRHVDPTGGATHYFSPAGMDLLIKQGHQSNKLPTWYEEEKQRSGGEIRIGGHVFIGKTNGDRSGERRPEPYESAENVQQFADVLGLDIGSDNADRIGQAFDLFTIKTGDFDNVAAVDEGVADTPMIAQGGTTELNELLAGYQGLSNEDKLDVFVQAAISQFAADNGDWFTDAGGYGILNALGAGPSEIAKINAAQTKWNNDRLNKFDADRELWKADILKRAEEGDDLTVLMADIDKRVASDELSDAAAQSLAASAASTIRSREKKDNSVFNNTAFLGEVGMLYQQIKSGALTDFTKTAAKGQALAEKYGATERDVQKLVTDIFQLDQSYQDSLRSGAKSAAEKAQRNASIAADVDKAISSGVGLNRVTGTIETKNASGQTERISAKEYGVQVVKDRWTEFYTKQIAEQNMSQEEASAGILRDTYRELSKHNVVDTQMQDQIRGALLGDIQDKTGKLDPAAVSAYSALQVLKTTPDIPRSYIKSLIGDDYVEHFFETAYMLDSGNMSAEQALVRAHSLMNQPFDTPEQKISKMVENRDLINTSVTEAMADMAEPGYLERTLPSVATYLLQRPDGASEAFSDPVNHARAGAYLKERADLYATAHPGTPAKVAIERAKTDLMRNGAFVQGSLILTDGVPLERRMGVDGYGEFGPDKAVQWFLQTYGNDTQMFGTFWSEDMLGGSSRIYTDYDPVMNTFTFDIDHPDYPGQPLGRPQVVDAAEIGKAYVEHMNKPSAWDTLINSAVSGTATGLSVLGSGFERMAEGDQR
ncbi:cell wall hydrolase [Pannonibacter sp. SL95]|uniref:cell wall hydrolase n=1 Tax=Pannonibacter sp. SL95 TaxID=2995153 RepID=UPI0022748350|nr:cell wall hydrolase [Pannonibacter sp. SL95]MCY1708357.1 cell wall hydrolase [Pannonibacter sp. SL95]